MVCTPYLKFFNSRREVSGASYFTTDPIENSYKHLQYFEEICATLMISGMNHETLK
jgi:hypothetical protein